MQDTAAVLSIYHSLNISQWNHSVVSFGSAFIYVIASLSESKKVAIYFLNLHLMMTVLMLRKILKHSRSIRIVIKNHLPFLSSKQ